jgi:hypothetical protein
VRCFGSDGARRPHVSDLGGYECLSEAQLSLLPTGEQDPQRAALAAILKRWNAIVGTKRNLAKELIAHATDFDPTNTSPDRRRFRHSEFREALLAVAGAGRL